MKYLLIKKNKLPQIHETNNIPNVITKMFGRKFRILNENVLHIVDHNLYMLQN